MLFILINQTLARKKKSNEENPLSSNNSTENDVEVLLELVQNPEMKDLIKMLASSLK